MTVDTHALLERLVGQFASPYDFLRELVQNAMDAGSDLVEVELHQHPGDHEGEVVFELVVLDAGGGMDEEIIDGELTRLFGTSKTDDRTMAGGFGIGFVSVFAWEPERVLLQTGRRGEAWELLFHDDRQFEKRPVDMPLEGTTVRLFRRGAPSQRRDIAEAVEDALRRWCRFAPIEITFDDVESAQGPREIAEPLEPRDVPCSVAWELGASRAVLAFGPQPQSVLLRRGLVLQEGQSATLLPVLGEAAGADSMAHLVARVDSPKLRTALARDGVVESADRDALERALVPTLTQLRAALVGRVCELVARPRWDRAAEDDYSHLHAHLQLEHGAIERLDRYDILRLATGTPISLGALARRARLGIVAVSDHDPLELRLVALRSGIPVLHGRWSVDQPWIEALLGSRELRALPLAEAVAVAEAVDTPPALARLTLSLLADIVRPKAMQWGVFEGSSADVLGGVALGGAGVVTAARWTSALLKERTLWLRVDHPVVQRASATAVTSPDVAAFGLAAAILSRGDAPVDALWDAWRAFG
ncbi:MAG: ATP-binding protein [Nannocystaceae bacterium]|nr:ATP-binding protein [bacterium]